jgi:hypothetical protein
MRAFASASERGTGGQRHNEQRETPDEHELDDSRDPCHDTCGNAA